MTFIEEGLVAFLKSGSPPLAGGRVYPVKAPQKTTDPYIIYEKASGERVRDLSGPTGQARPRIRIHIYGKKYSDVKNVSQGVRQLMDGYSGLMGTIQVDACSLITEADLYEDDTEFHHNVLDFLVSHEET